MRKRQARFQSQAAEAESAMAPLCLEFALSPTKAEEDAWGLTLVYQNRTTGLQLQFSPGEQAGWHAIVAKLIDGSFPKHPIHIREGVELNRFDLRDLAAERITQLSELAERIKAKSPLSVGQVAELIRSCARDVMIGDFGVFPALASRVNARARAL